MFGLGLSVPQVALRGLRVPAFAPPPYWYNYDHARIANAAPAKQAQLAGTDYLRIVILGDSTGEGQAYGAADPSMVAAARLAGAYDKNPGAKLAGLVTRGNIEGQMRPADLQNSAASGYTPRQAMLAYNPRFDSGAWEYGTGFFATSTDGSPSLLKPRTPVDTFEIVTASAAYGDMGYTFPRADGATATVTKYDTGQDFIRYVAKFATASTSAVSLSAVNTSAKTYFHGWRAWNSAIKSVDVITSATGGIKASTTNSEGIFGFLTQVEIIQPHIVFVNLLLNEEQLGDTPANGAAALDGIYTKLTAAIPGVTIIPVFPPATSAISDAAVQQFRDAAAQVCVAHNLMMLDLYKMVGPYAQAPAGFYYDQTHGLEPYSTAVAAAYKAVYDAI